MKKLVIFFITVFILFKSFPGLVHAQEIEISEPPATDSSRVDTTPKIDYDLAYPGILPDNPLYFLKAGRDRIVAFFISNPLRKADFEILMADKRVLASYMLSQKGKNDLAKDTFSKAENYFEDALDRADDAKSQGMNTLEIVHKLSLSNSKHQEVFSEIQKTIGKSETKKWEKEATRLKDLEKRVRLLRSEK